MASLRNLLPAPTQTVYAIPCRIEQDSDRDGKKEPFAHLPPYGKRKGWTPRKVSLLKYWETFSEIEARSSGVTSFLS